MLGVRCDVNIFKLTGTGTFPSFLEMNKTAGSNSLQICVNLSQIHRETKAFSLKVSHNTEGPPISDWQWRHCMLFFFVVSQNRVNLVLFFKPLSIWNLSTGGGANVYGEEWRKFLPMQEDARRDVDDEEEENCAVVLMWGYGDNAGIKI